jgi:predicted nucleic acid-binding protein
MPAVVVDTDVVSFTFKRDRRALPFRRHLLGRTLVISFMTLAELRAWPLIRQWGPVNRDRLTRHLGRYLVHYADDALCERWAEVSSQARAKGHPIDVADAWIAATALTLGVPLATNNPSDYAGLDGLTIMSGSTP